MYNNLLRQQPSIVRFLTIFFIFFKIFPVYVFAQEMPIKTVVLPPSPNASSLGKFGDYQVSEFTGLPNISLPIFDVKIKDFVLPINLSYHASGIKVDEIASLVGMGWALSAGGQVTRVVRGRPDEETTFGFQAVGATYHNFIDPTASNFNFDFFEKLAYGRRDGEPDEYFYSFGNKSGKFVIGLNNKPVILANDNIKIENLSTGFIITDEYGIKYFFNHIEKTRPEVPGDINMYDYISTWCLSKIEDVNGIVLLAFEYDDYSQTFDTGRSETKLEKISGTCPIGGTFHQSINTINIDGKRLKKINFTGGSVEFISEFSRKDILGNALSKINVFSNKQLIKSVDLDYFYHSNRLFLNKVIDLNLEGGSPAVTKLNYDYATLPERLSYSQDHWGYSGNGASTLIPKTEQQGIIYNGADRSPTSQTKAGILESIIYPTKGSTKFVFENNDYYTDGLKKVFAGAGMRQRCNRKDRLKFDTVEFNVEFAQVAISDLKYSYTNDMCAGGSGASYTLQHEDGTFVRVFSGTGIQVRLNKGKYTLIGMLECESCDDFRADFTLSFSKYVPYEANEIGPALRIKEIINFTDSLSSVADYIQYSYNDIVNDKRSTGVIFSTPIYDYYYSEKLPPFEGFGTCQYYVRTSNSMSELGSCRGGLVGYTTVTKKKYDSVLGFQGKTVNFYKINKKVAISKYPFPPITDLEYQNGMLEKQMVYDQNDKLIQETSHLYESKGPTLSDKDKFVNGVKVAFASKSYTTGINGGNSFAFQYYSYSTNWRNLIKTTVRNFDNAGNVTEESTEYEYKNEYVFPNKLTKTSSTGHLMKSSNFFPIDFYSDATYRRMVEKNMLKIEVKKDIEFENKLIESSKVDFIIIDNSKIVAERLLKFDRNNNMISSLVNFKFDNYYNPQEVQKQFEPITTYLWGYGGQYPIAAIKNATYAEIEKVLSKATIDAMNSPLVTETTITNAMSKMRTDSRLSKAMVTSYTYKPLVGMTSKTDPRGVIEHYEYDGMLRLKAVLDQVKNVTTSMDYHYRTN